MLGIPLLSDKFFTVDLGDSDAKWFICCDALLNIMDIKFVLHDLLLDSKIFASTIRSKIRNMIEEFDNIIKNLFSFKNVW